MNNREILYSSTTTFGSHLATPHMLEASRFHPVSYSPENQSLWRKILIERGKFIVAHGHSSIIKGMTLLGISSHQIPDLATVDAKLFDYTGWRITVVDGGLKEAELYELVARRIRPVHFRMRSGVGPSRTPDILHDIFHLFCLFEPDLAEFLHELAVFYQRASSEGRKDLFVAVARLAWHLVEYGITKTKEGWKAYGPILNETDEGVRVFKNQHLIRSARFQEIVAAPAPWEGGRYYLVGDPMKAYFAIDSFSDLLTDFREFRIAE